MHFLLSTVVLQTAILCTAVSNFGQRPFSDDSRAKILNTRVNAAISSILKEFKTPGGVGVAVVQKNQDSGWRIETRGYGLAKVDGTRVTEDTLFAIGSNSKLFDVLATGLLISNETLSPRISWNTKIASVMPEWGLMDPVASSETTVEDAMSHRTGVPRHDFILHADVGTVSETIGRLRYLKPSTGFRELWQYNNFMYTVLSYFPPLLTGIPFETYVNDFILQPLGMNSTTYFSRTAADSGNLADGMARDGVNQTEDVFGLGRNPVDGEIVIPEDVIRRVAAGVTVAVPAAQFPELSPVVYGGGQTRGTYRGFEFIEHGGTVPGFKSQITRIPNQNFGVAVLSNDESFGFQIAEAVKFRIIDEVLDLEVIDWSARFKSLITAQFNGRPISTPRSPSPTLPSIPFNALAGTYRDPGYGILELCLISPESLIASASESCRQLIDEIPTTLPATLDPHIPTLLARWNGFRITHVYLAHFEQNLFNVTSVLSIPTGNSSDKPYWVQKNSHPNFVAEFSFEGTVGVGLRGLWGPGEGVESPRGESVEDRAEVWFAKIDDDDR